MLGIAWFMGARFDLAWERAMRGEFSKPTAGELAEMLKESAVKASATVTEVVREKVTGVVGGSREL